MNKILVKDYLKINGIIGEITSKNKSIILDIFGTNKLYLYNNVLNNISHPPIIKSIEKLFIKIIPFLIYHM